MKRQRDDMAPARSKAVVAAIALFVLLGSLEVMLGALAAVFSRVEILLGPPWQPYGVAETIHDDQLGHRLNPDYPGHDGKGFSNPAALKKATIVALGDSHTYPTGIEPHLAWPRQLESLTRETTYSLAVPGYGPVHSLLLWDEVVALDPEIVIEAFYAGNDLFDAFDMVYNRGRIPELKSADDHWRQRVREAEGLEPIAERVGRMYGMADEGQPASESAVRAFLSQHSKLFGLLRRTRYELPRILRSDPWENAKAFADAHPEYCQVFSSGQFKTIFTSEYRLSALNLADPRIAEGHHISLGAIMRMNELARERRIRFVVALIPTKELVFAELWNGSSESFNLLTENERRLWKMTKQFLDENEIEYVDVLPALRGELAEGIQPYHVSHDGHPNERGHRAIAKIMRRQLVDKRHGAGT